MWREGRCVSALRRGNQGPALPWARRRYPPPSSDAPGQRQPTTPGSDFTRRRRIARSGAGATSGPSAVSRAPASAVRASRAATSRTAAGGSFATSASGAPVAGGLAARGFFALATTFDGFAPPGFAPVPVKTLGAGAVSTTGSVSTTGAASTTRAAPERRTGRGRSAPFAGPTPVGLAWTGIPAATSGFGAGLARTAFGAVSAGGAACLIATAAGLRARAARAFARATMILARSLRTFSSSRIIASEALAMAVCCGAGNSSIAARKARLTALAPRGARVGVSALAMAAWQLLAVSCNNSTVSDR